MKKRILSLLLVGICVFAPQLSYAEDVQKVRMVVVDVQNILKRSLAVKDILQQLEEKRKAFQADITKDENVLKNEDSELKKQRNLLSQEAFEQKRKEFQAKVTKVQRDVQEKRVFLDRAYAEALSKVQKKTYAIIEGLALEKGFDVAIPKSQTLYNVTALDISQEVLSRLNKHLPKVRIEVKQDRSKG